MSWKTNKGENLLRNKTKQKKQIMQVQKLLKLSFCGGYIQNESTPGQKTLSTLFRRRWIREGKNSRKVLCLISGLTKDQKRTRLKNPVAKGGIWPQQVESFAIKTFFFKFTETNFALECDNTRKLPISESEIVWKSHMPSN